MEPTKNVTASVLSPTRLTNPGNGPMRKHVDPLAKKSAIQRSRLMGSRRSAR
jgi:hypothetical protein